MLAAFLRLRFKNYIQERAYFQNFKKSQFNKALDGVVAIVLNSTENEYRLEKSCFRSNILVPFNSLHQSTRERR